MSNDKTWIALVLAAVTAGASMGCGRAAISPQLASARRTMEEARSGAAGRLEPDELLVAQRTLTTAEGQDDGSPREQHFAYLAERQTRVAMADARRDEVQQGLEQDHDAYQRELERIAHERGRALEETRGALAARDQTLAQRESQLSQQEQQLEAERQARAEAEARAQDALARLRDLATVREEPTQTVITLTGDVLFESDRSELRPEAQERLRPVADAIRATGDTAVIVGFTDSRGSDEYNRQLSQRRAESVRNFLIGEGVQGDRIRAEGRGETSPIASNDTAEGRAENRRVEISLHPSQVAAAEATASGALATR